MIPSLKYKNMIVNVGGSKWGEQQRAKIDELLHREHFFSLLDVKTRMRTLYDNLSLLRAKSSCIPLICFVTIFVWFHGQSSRSNLSISIHSSCDYGAMRMRD